MAVLCFNTIPVLLWTHTCARIAIRMSFDFRTNLRILCVVWVRWVRTIGSNLNSPMWFLVFPGLYRNWRIVNRSPGYSEITNPRVWLNRNCPIVRSWAIRPFDRDQTFRTRCLSRVEPVWTFGSKFWGYGTHGSRLTKFDQGLTEGLPRSLCNSSNVVELVRCNIPNPKLKENKLN